MLRDLGREDAALAAYRRAVDALRATRRRPCLRVRRARRRVAPGRRRRCTPRRSTSCCATRRGRPTRRCGRRCCGEARGLVESAKADELRDYFRDECVTALGGRTVSLDDLTPRTAVVYPIVLADRLELLGRGRRRLHQRSVGRVRRRACGGGRRFPACAAAVPRQRTRDGRQATARPARRAARAGARRALDRYAGVRARPVPARHTPGRPLRCQAATWSSASRSSPRRGSRSPTRVGSTRPGAGCSPAASPGRAGASPRLPAVAGELAALGPRPPRNAARRRAVHRRRVSRRRSPPTPYRIGARRHATAGSRRKRAGSFLLTYDGRLSMDERRPD